MLKIKAYFYKPLYTSTDTEYLKIPMNVSLELCKDALVSDNCYLIFLLVYDAAVSVHVLV